MLCCYVAACGCTASLPLLRAQACVVHPLAGLVLVFAECVDCIVSTSLGVLSLYMCFVQVNHTERLGRCWRCKVDASQSPMWEILIVVVTVTVYKLQFLQSNVTSLILYGAETWTDTMPLPGFLDELSQAHLWSDCHGLRACPPSRAGT